MGSHLEPVYSLPTVHTPGVIQREKNIAGQIMKALLLLLVFSRSSYGRPQIGSTEPEQQNIVSLQSGQQQFMNRLLQQIESNTTTNFVLSPHSIHSVFSQLLQGSGGRTKEE